MLTTVYGTDCLSRARMFEWHKKFSVASENVEEDKRPGRPLSSRTEKKLYQRCSFDRIDSWRHND